MVSVALYRAAPRMPRGHTPGLDAKGSLASSVSALRVVVAQAGCSVLGSGSAQLERDGEIAGVRCSELAGEGCGGECFD